jgi:FtsP/CotA-like multicopper oxidase with cupredoxin domain
MRHPGALLIAAIVGSMSLLAAGTPAQEGKTRHYYLAAEDGVWDYAPGGKEQMHGGAVPGPWTRSTRWTKARYVEYTDDTFTTKKPQPAWLGVLGPVLRAEVGDTVVVHFLNRTRRPRSVHPHGLRYTKEHEGAVYQPAGAGARVAPGGRFTYTWTADDGSGPGPGDPSSIVWWYHSHVDESADVNAGLLGPLVVTARGRARADGAPADVDREFVAMLMIFDEARGEERGLMHSINGFVFGNVPGFVANRGERVRWYLLGMGNEKDLHTLHWHGKTLRSTGRNTDVIELLPGSMATADMVADNPGTWLMHCHVADHLNAGMFATYTIGP